MPHSARRRVRPTRRPGEDRTGQCRGPGRAEQAGRERPAPYNALAALAAAQLLDKPEEQVAALEAVSAKLPPELSDLALVIAGFRSVDTGKFETVVAKLDPLAMPDRPFHASVTSCRRWQRRARNDSSAPRAMDGDRQGSRLAAGEQQRAQAMLTYYGPGEGK